MFKPEIIFHTRPTGFGLSRKSGIPTFSKYNWDLQKWALYILYDYFNWSYEELLWEGGKSTTNENRLKALCVEIWKILNDLNPNFMKNLSKLKENVRVFCDE